MLLDSNIIIYAALPEHGALRRLIAENGPAVSAVSYVEVLGYHQLSTPDREYYQAFFDEARILPLSQPILDEAVRLRQLRKMSLGDSLIAGTALVHDLTLVTRNTGDFTWVTELRVLNPFGTDSPRSDEAGH
jgi:toxin FitB